MNPLDPGARVLCKVGSIVVHMDEATDLGGHAFDVQAFRTLLADPEVVAWLDAMRAIGMIPVKRWEKSKGGTRGK